MRNCGEMGLDWHTISLSGYLEALEAHNEAHEPQTPEVSDWLKKRVNGDMAHG